ncbi:twin-arginine translocase TatA/TatE family subunit [Patulibacter sp. NPDC049589]|uniref:Sec-independent protein translocase subunit TatA/TatB n=1 Tax=Patulibacter sp. NPDC049589 TaxID=3154731 RepID=UPI00344677C0
MPLGIGPMEIVVVLVIALVVIGPKKLPGMAKSMGSGVREFRDSLSGDSDDRDETPAKAKPVGSARGEAV